MSFTRHFLRFHLSKRDHLGSNIQPRFGDDSETRPQFRSRSWRPKMVKTKVIH